MSRAQEKPHKQYGIILPVPEKIAAKLESAREKYLPSRLHIPAHVTLVFPFGWARQEGELRRIIEAAAQATPAFEAVLSGVGAFPHNGVVFLRVEDSGQLKRLHLRLVEELGLSLSDASKYRDFERDNYLPHITLAADLPPEEFRRAWTELRSRDFSGSFPVEEFSLHRQTEGNDWELVASFRLQPRGKPR